MTWVDDYLAAVAVRDAREHANKRIYDAYTKLADHTAALSSRTSSSTPPQPETSTTATFTPPPNVVAASRMSSVKSSAAPPFSGSDTITTLRADLTHAQTTRIALATELASMTETMATLQSTLTTTSSTANSLAREKAVLERKLRDRDDELREKRRMLERVQDDVVALEMQVNLLEQERDGVREKV